MSRQPTVLHLLLVRLKPGSAEDARRALLAEAEGLATIGGVTEAGAVEANAEGATHALAFFAFLRDRAALEEFGADPAHVRFLRATLAPYLESLAAADVSVDAAPPEAYAAACCFCTPFPPEAYDWQVRGYLNQVRASLGDAAHLCAGPALDDRQAFRAAGIAFWPGVPDDLSVFQDRRAAGRTPQALVAGPAQRFGASREQERKP